VLIGTGTIAMLHLDILHLATEFIRDDLRERRLQTLAMGRNTERGSDRTVASIRIVEVSVPVLIGIPGATRILRPDAGVQQQLDRPMPTHRPSLRA
jgi:hypothetical protein